MINDVDPINDVLVEIGFVLGTGKNENISNFVKNEF